MTVFPSQEWFDRVREVYNTTEHSGGGGACDTQAGICIGDQHYLLVFSGLKCSEVKPVTENELGNTDFNLVMPLADWKAMISNIQENGKASSNFTLNSLDLKLEDGLARSPLDDQYREDLFYRYNQNFQDFFDFSAAVETTIE